MVMAVMCCVATFGQDDQIVGRDADIFEQPEVMPSFPGGMDGLISWLSENIQYPQNAVNHDVKGRVIVTFVIDTDGSVIEPKVVRSLNPVLDFEALRVVGTMPKWNPGKLNGKPVKVKYTLPISFKQ